MSWDITIGHYRLAMLDSVEIHKSVDLLASTCVIKLPGAVYNKALKIEDEDGKDKIVRGDQVIVRCGYNGNTVEEFRGYLLTIATDDGSISISCEDDVFLLRKSVPNHEFVNRPLSDIARYVLNETDTQLELQVDFEETTPIFSKFVINNATGYDVLKKLKEETGASIYIRDSKLFIQPPYVVSAGSVTYSFQDNVEKSDLKYVRAGDKRIEVVVEYVDKDGQKRQYSYGTTGGDRVSKSGNGLSEDGAAIVAKNEYDSLMYDGYEGSITGWLQPYVSTGYGAKIKDADYEYKEGVYYINSVTTSFGGSGGGVRKVQLGKRLL